MPITAPEGYLDISNATLRGSEIITTSNVGIMNANPTMALSVGSNLHVNAYSSNVLEVNGNVVAEGLKLGFIEILPSYDLAAVSNVGNVTDSTIQFSNATTAFVTTSNIEVGTANLFVDTTTGRVGVGTTNPGYTLDVNGTSNAATYYQNGVEIYAQRRWEVDLTGQTNTNFYPVELRHPTYEGSPDLPDLFPVHFKVFGESLGGGDPYNESTLVGYARGGGYSDHGGMCDVHYRRYRGSEKRFEGLYEGAADYGSGIVIYMRGGYRYSVLTDATEVNTYTSAQTLDNSVFAIKNVSGGDVSGTSSNILRLAHIAETDDDDKRIMSGTLTTTGNVGIGTANPLARLDVNGSLRTRYSSGYRSGTFDTTGLNMGSFSELGPDMPQIGWEIHLVFSCANDNSTVKIYGGYRTSGGVNSTASGILYGISESSTWRWSEGNSHDYLSSSEAILVSGSASGHGSYYAVIRVVNSHYTNADEGNGRLHLTSECVGTRAAVGATILKSVGFLGFAAGDNGRFHTLRVTSSSGNIKGQWTGFPITI